jgi:hypothetical protein
MSRRFTCSSGHEWDAAEGASVLCPVCSTLFQTPPPFEPAKVPPLAPGALASPSSPGPDTLTWGDATPAGAPPQVPGYEVLEELGRGGMGVVETTYS